MHYPVVGFINVPSGQIHFPDLSSALESLHEAQLSTLVKHVLHWELQPHYPVVGFIAVPSGQIHFPELSLALESLQEAQLSAFV